MTLLGLLAQLARGLVSALEAGTIIVLRAFRWLFNRLGAP
jgi:hypothetical protein